MRSTPPAPSAGARPGLGQNASRGIAAAGVPGSGLQLMQGALMMVAVLYFGRELLIPLVLAILLSFVLAPVVRALGKLWLPRSAAVLVGVALACAAILGMGALVGSQVTSLAENIPVYQATVQRKLSGIQAAGGLMDRVANTLREMSRAGGAPAAPTATPPLATSRSAPIPVEIHTPDPTAIEVIQRLAEPLLGPLATAGIVVILVIFILLYREDLRDRLIRLAGARDLHRTMAAMDDAAYRLARFFLAQTAMNTGYGLAIAGALWAIGIPNPLLWGFVAGLMRFVPFIGSFIAVIFPAVLAIAVDPGWGTLVWVLALFGLSEMLMGQVFEPLVFSHSTGLSPVAVIAAATFWTWLWGPIGLLLSVPLTVCLVVLGRHVDRLEFLEVMLGDRPPLDPEETFYQRALAGDADALAEQADRGLKDVPLATYLDAVTMPALRLGQADVAHGALTPERLQALQRSVEVLLEDLQEAEDPKLPPGEAPPAPLPAGWTAAGAVLCVPGRGPFDALAAAIFAQVLARRGFGVQLGGAPAVDGATAPLLVCLVLIEGGSSAATARYQVRRARRRLPGVPTLALVWSPADATEAEGGVQAALRAEAQGKGAGAAGGLQLAATLAEALERSVGLAGSAAPEPPQQAPVAVAAPELPPLGATPAPA